MTKLTPPTLSPYSRQLSLQWFTSPRFRGPRGKKGPGVRDDP